MKKFHTILLCLFCSLPSFAQISEYYLNEHKQKTDSASAVYIARAEQQNALSNNIKVTIQTLQGNIVSESEYKNDLLDGITKLYHPNKNLKAEISYKNGLLHGDVKTYYYTGNIKRHDVFDKGALLQGTCFGMNGSRDRYTDFYTPPSYIGGERALYKFVFLNTYYPDEVKLEKINGTVTVRLLISKKGEIIDREIAQSLHPELDKEALRVANLITKFTPAKQDGEFIESVYMLSVPFEIRN
ncbi:MAG: TonB family protein [Bacteroidetes bacterium]|nr:TonB family protein [Bacteroidota bacterium]